MCVYACYIHAGACRGQKKIESSAAGLTAGCEPVTPHKLWLPNSGLPEEWQVLTMEPFFYPEFLRIFHFLNYCE